MKPLTDKCMVCGRDTWSDYVPAGNKRPAPCTYDSRTGYVSCKEHWSHTAAVQRDRVLAWKALRVVRGFITQPAQEPDPRGKEGRGTSGLEWL